MAESATQKAVLDYLALKKHFFWRQNSSGSFYTGKDGQRAFRKPPKYALNGVPDIIVIKDGWFIGLEIKDKGAYQSKDQKAFEKMCKDAGGEYYVIRSVDQLKEIGL